MVSTPTHFTTTDRVIIRLQAEGWVDCPGLGFPALSQIASCDLTSFVLVQLHDLGWIWQTELQLQSLIFSVTTHEFQVHPHLRQVLNQLEAEGTIVIQSVNKPANKLAGLKNKVETAIVLSSLYSDRLAKQIEQILIS